MLLKLFVPPREMLSVAAVVVSREQSLLSETDIGRETCATGGRGGDTKLVLRYIFYTYNVQSRIIFQSNQSF